MKKTDKQLLDDYLEDDDFYQHLYGDMKYSYRHAVGESFEFARYRLAVSIRELGKAILEAMGLRR